ncbi:MAG: universal stress protein [Thermoleophilia bacterium]|nr:universal stress protein [Thermoleophilia bacterium]
MATPRIVVGIDGSEGSLEALRFALEEARLRGGEVAALFAWSIPFVADVPTGLLPEVIDDFRADAEKLLEEQIAAVGDSGGVEIERIVVEGPPAQALVGEAEGATLLVVGSRGRGGFKGLLLGSVSSQCMQHAPCPVVVVPARES